jgi:hypothetical protein
MPALITKDNFETENHFIPIPFPIPQENETLLQFVKRCYPSDDSESRFSILEQRDSEKPIETYLDFAQVVKEMSEDGEQDMNIYKSSTWAVCQEFLGKLNEEELLYSNNRGGIWYSNVEQGEYISITIRKILNILKVHYP